MSDVSGVAAVAEQHGHSVKLLGCTGSEKQKPQCKNDDMIVIRGKTAAINCKRQVVF